MNKALLIIALTISTLSNAQNTGKVMAPVPQPKWKLTALYGANGTQTSFVNWNAGGRNNISLLGYFSGSANYTNDRFKWSNNLDLSLGALQFIGKEADGESLQKTDDRIDLSSTLGYQFKNHKKVYWSLVGGFRTQFLDGFVYPNDSVRVSTFLAPGYINLSLGIDYKPNEFFALFVSPIAGKVTIVNDEILANAGSFGVEGATFDGLGNVITAGKRVRGEFGAYLKMTYNKEIVKNIEMKSKLELFSNYIDRPQNIDVNADILFTFKVNSWFSASLNWTAIYDHDIRIQSNDGGFGPRLQFKSVLGVGVSYTMRNYEEEKKK